MTESELSPCVFHNGPVKGTHTVYFINQNPMIPKTHFHCKKCNLNCNHMSCTFFSVKFDFVVTNEQNTSFLDCKHKHMMKNRAPPDKVGVLYSLLPVEFHSFTSRIDF